MSTPEVQMRLREMEGVLRATTDQQDAAFAGALETYRRVREQEVLDAEWERQIGLFTD